MPTRLMPIRLTDDQTQNNLSQLEPKSLWIKIERLKIRDSRAVDFQAEGTHPHLAAVVWQSQSGEIRPLTRQNSSS